MEGENERIEEVEKVEWKSESEGEGRVKREKIDGGRDEENVSLCILFEGHNGIENRTSLHLLRNKREKKEEEEEENTTESTPPSSPSSNVGLILLVVFLVLLLLLAVGAIIYLITRFSRYVRRKEEEERKKKEEGIKERGIEMKEKEVVSSGEIYGDSMGKFEKEEEDDKEIKKEEEKKEDENCSSTGYLLPPARITRVAVQKETEAEKRMIELSEEEEKKKKEEEEKKKKEEEEKKKMEEEEEREKERERAPPSTSSLSFIIDGLSCFEPFEIEVVSSLDTVLNFILHPEKRMKLKEREREGERLCCRIIPLLLHILPMEEEERERWLIGFGPIGIVKNVENEFILF
jgi:cytoskeletal protein RodZ